MWKTYSAVPLWNVLGNCFAWAALALASKLITVLFVGVMDVLGPPVSSGLLRPLAAAAAAAAAAEAGTIGTVLPLLVVVGESWPAPFVVAIWIPGAVSGIVVAVPETIIVTFM